MKATISINMNDAAFQDCAGNELSRILRELADSVEDSERCELVEFEKKIRDVNGNTVGIFEIN